MHRYASDKGIALIRHFEGFRAARYIDAAGIPTIGIGHAIRKGEAFTMIGIEQAESLLRGDLYRAEASVLRLITVPLSAGQFDALVSFCFNLGGGRLQASTLRRKINRGEGGIRREFTKWYYAGGRKLPGLVLRRAAEADLYES